MVPTVFLLPINQGYCPLLKEKGETYPKKQICKVKSIGPHFILLFWVREWNYPPHPSSQWLSEEAMFHSLQDLLGLILFFGVHRMWNHIGQSLVLMTWLLSWSHMTTLVSAFTVSRLLELKPQSGCGQEEGSKEPPSGTQPQYPAGRLMLKPERLTFGRLRQEDGSWV